jgi:hypothetical protein
MLIEVQVKTGTSQLKIEKLDSNKYQAWLTKKPAENEANKQLISLVADYFKNAKSKVNIISGSKSRIKLVEIDI